jgi:hypothetical protein
MDKRVVRFEDVGYANSNAEVAKSRERIPHKGVELQSFFEACDGLFLIIVTTMKSSQETQHCRRIRKSSSGCCAMLS